MRGEGRTAFAAILLMIVGVLNIIYGIGAVDNANIIVNDTRFIFSDLSAMGWLLIVIGVVQLIGGLSLIRGAIFGRIIGVVAGSISAIVSLISVGGAYPWWSLGIFFLSVWIVYGILIYGEDERSLT